MNISSTTDLGICTKNDYCGVYRIVNNINCKLYIGSSIHINRRFVEHISALRRNCHGNKHLQMAWNTYGEENFEFEIIELIEDFENLLVAREQYWMDYYSSYNPILGYNISHYASGSGGYEVSDETREKLRRAATGRKYSSETKEKLSSMRRGKLNSFYGKHHTEETKKLLSDKAKKRDPSSRNISGFAFSRGTQCYTEDTYRKLSESHRGEKSGTAKLKEDDVVNILKMVRNKIPYSEIKSKYHIAYSQISRIKSGERWAHF